MSGVRDFVKKSLFPRHSRLGRLLRRARRAFVDKRYAPPYDKAELLARAEELNRNAEAYWRAVDADPSARADALHKPWTTIEDASNIFYRFGLTLAALRLGVGHLVLDLGAGTCWFSAYLNRLGCRTISMDISPTALKLGRERFRLDPSQKMDLDPQFVVYDGRVLPLPDESVDRVVCFDAFHHVPNPNEILAEIHRVLSRGGRAVFAEPGEGHERSSLARFEIQRFGVLENELDLEALADEAKRLGFTDFLVKPYPDASAMTLSAREYFELMDGHDRFFPIDGLRRSLRDFYLFILVKGPEALDSRNPGKLRAVLDVPAAARVIRGPAGSPGRIPCTVRNGGDTLWLHEALLSGGYVRLGGHLLEEDSTVLAWDYFRAPLPESVPAGGTVFVNAEFRLPEKPGQYILRLDLVDENVAWFAQRGSETVDVELAAGPASVGGP